MDVEAPPPFAGAVNGLSDSHDDLRLTISDDDEDVHASEFCVPSNIPLPSPEISHQMPEKISVPTFKKEEVQVDVTSFSTASEFSEVPVAVENEDKTTSDTVSSPSETEPTSSKSEESVKATESTSTACNGGFSAEERTEDPSEAEASFSQLEVHTANGIPGDEVSESEDDFGDFADFEQAPQLLVESTVKQTQSDDEEWGDFDKASRLSRQASLADSVPPTPTNRDDEDDWAAFSEPAQPTNKADPSSNQPGSSSEWAAEFDDFAVAPSTYVETPAVENLPTLDDLVDDSSVWEICSEEEDCALPPEAVCSIPDSFDRDDPVKQLNAEDVYLKDGAELWLALRIVEEAVALKYQWKTAQFRNDLFKVLRIDPDALGRGAFPAFNTDDVLKPTLLNCNGSSRRAVFVSPGGSTAKVQPGSDETDTSPESEPPAKNETPPPTAAPLQPTSACIDSLSVPPADFDWEDSGLTNPLKGASRTSALLDVDFLSVNSGGSCSTVSTLQRDLDELGLSTPPANKSLPKPASQPSLLDTIMSTAAAREKKFRPVSELSLDARALHDQLPDIEYLRASMIMFPMGHTNNPSE